MILTNTRILTLDAENRVLQNASLEIRDGRIGQFSPPLQSEPVIDCQGKLLMPALINCHTHLYSTLARGVALPGRPPRNFPEILRKLWWRLDRALTEEDVYYSALIGLIDSAKLGVGTVIDHHSSPNACAGSLDRIAQAFREVGLRGATCYETSDRNGAWQAAEGIRENVRFLEAASRAGDAGPAGAFGLHAAFTLSDRTLRQCAEANQSLRAPVHIHVAEDRCDAGAVKRLHHLGLLDDRTLAAHAIHITPAERRTLAGLQVNVIHNPQSNAANRVGAADLTALVRRGALVGLGSDGFTPRLWDEFKASPDRRAAYAALLTGNREIVRKAFGMDVGRIETGASADLVLLDYYPPTPINAGNLYDHVLFGISNALVDSLIVNGRFVVRDRRCVNVDERCIAEKAATRARALWERLGDI